MRSGYLIPVMVAVGLMLAGCGGEAAETEAAAAPAVPAPALADLPPPYNAADMAAGKSLFGKKCSSCHFLDAGKGNMVGPNLHGVFDRGTAAAKGYGYSPALKAFDPEMWTAELVDQWLAAPQSFVSGSSMFFSGISDASERRDLIAFLLVQSRK